MAAPVIYLDECVHHDLVGALRRRDISVTAARDEEMTGATDEEQLVYAASCGWLLLTHNADDFRSLHGAYQEQGRVHAGIIVLPQSTVFRVLELRAAMMVDWLGTLSRPGSELFRWGQLQELLERGYRLTGYSEADVRIVLGQQGAEGSLG